MDKLIDQAFIDALDHAKRQAIRWGGVWCVWDDCGVLYVRAGMVTANDWQLRAVAIGYGHGMPRLQVFG